MVSAKFLELLSLSEARDLYTVEILSAEPTPAYDRVHLSGLFSGQGEKDLELFSPAWYKENNYDLHLGEEAVSLDRANKTVTASSGKNYKYDKLIFATGSAPFVPPLEGLTGDGIFTYRDFTDVEKIKTFGKSKKTAAVIGGGLLGLEAAKALKDLGLGTTVVEMAPRLMPRQLDESAAGLLLSEIETLGIKVRLNSHTEQLAHSSAVKSFIFKDGGFLDVDMVVVSAGIKANDQVAKSADLKLGARGGLDVTPNMVTSDPDILAIGEVASFEGQIQGLVAPAYEMARVAIETLTGGERIYGHPYLSTKLKLLGIEVASFGDALAETKDAQVVSLANQQAKTYKKLVLDATGSAIIGGIFVGDTAQYFRLMQMSQTGAAIPEDAASLLVPGSFQSGGGTSLAFIPNTAVICNCENITKGQLIEAIQKEGITEISELKAKTKCGTGCGGCQPMMVDILAEQLEAQGIERNTDLCEHFSYSRTELFGLAKKENITTYAALLQKHGTGKGCEICKPVIANLLASAWNLPVLEQQNIQDTNDSFLANIQKNGSYSVIPRMPGGEITPKALIELGKVADEFGLFVKLTGGERVAMFGARLDDLPKIWAKLVAAGYESGHAYGKSLRTVKSCVGSTWCPLGVGNSLDMAVTLENRYKGLRGPHKIKGAASGCMRECAEAQSKDFGVIATEKGWNLFVSGNGGIIPQHGQLLATDATKEEVLKYVDRFLIYYFRTSDKVTRTSTWINQLEGGIEHLKEVIINDSLGIAHELDKDMQNLVDQYKCEWKLALESPEKLATFKTFLNTDLQDDSIKFEESRGQKKPLMAAIV